MCKFIFVFSNNFHSFIFKALMRCKKKRKKKIFRENKTNHYTWSTSRANPIPYPHKHVFIIVSQTRVVLATRRSHWTLKMLRSEAVKARQEVKVEAAVAAEARCSIKRVSGKRATAPANYLRQVTHCHTGHFLVKFAFRLSTLYIVHSFVKIDRWREHNNVSLPRYAILEAIWSMYGYYLTRH